MTESARDGPAPDATTAPSDRSLLRRLRGGSEDAATQLYRRYAHRLRALARANTSAHLARRVDAEDIVQSVFRIFFTAASQGLYDVPAGEDLWKLLLVIALNKIRTEGDFHQAAKRDVRTTAELDRLARAPGPGGPGSPPPRSRPPAPTTCTWPSGTSWSSCRSRSGR